MARGVPSEVRSWLASGTSVRRPDGTSLWVLDTGPDGPDDGPPVLLVHGFPTSSWDWRGLVGQLRARRRVVAVDLPGFGGSDKPDRPYGIVDHADAVLEVVGATGLTEVDLVTHDMGDTVGGALLERQLDDPSASPVRVRRRVLVNGSIYLGMASLTPGQRLAERLPDRRLPSVATPVMRALYRTGIARTFGDQPAAASELDAAWALMSRGDGHLLLPRLVRYLDDRRSHEARWTGAIERHPAQMTVVWGAADPVARVAMVDRLLDARPDAEVVRLEGVGHFPMLEAPDAFTAAVLDALEAHR